MGGAFCRTWSRFDTFIRKPTERWSGRAIVWQEEPIETNVSAYWDPASEEAWVLLSDVPAGRSRIAEYALRMRVEATFEDQKSRGWNLEASGIDSAGTPGSAVSGSVSGDVVGLSSGGILHTSWRTSPF